MTYLIAKFWRAAALTILLSAVAVEAQEPVPGQAGPPSVDTIADPPAQTVERNVTIDAAAAEALASLDIEIDAVRFCKNFAVLMKDSYPHTFGSQLRAGLFSVVVTSIISVLLAVAATALCCSFFIKRKLLWTGKTLPTVVTVLWIGVIGAGMLTAAGNLGVVWVICSNMDRILVEEKLAEAAVASTIMAVICEQNDKTLADGDQVVGLNELVEQSQETRQDLVDAVPRAIDVWAKDKGRQGRIVQKLMSVEFIREQTLDMAAEQNPYGFYVALVAMQATADGADAIDVQEALLAPVEQFFADMNKALLSFTKSMWLTTLGTTAVCLAAVLLLIGFQKHIGRSIARLWRKIFSKSGDDDDAVAEAIDVEATAV